MWRRGKLSTYIFILQTIFIVLFAIFVKYDKDADAKHKKDDDHHRTNGTNMTEEEDGNDGDDGNEWVENDLQRLYPMFQDVHVMMFIGFGYLMTFLKRYGFSSVGFNFIICAFVIQWATLMGGFIHMHDNEIPISIENMLTSDFACAAVLISFGAVLGKTSPLQLLVMAFLEIIVFQVNEYVGVTKLQAVDVGGSMFVHVFGAYFGITVARILYKPALKEEEIGNKEGSHYHSDLFSVIGTLFLWMFWPSFNSAVAATPDAQHRAVLNTYFALCASTMMTFGLSCLLDEEDKFDMVHVQNATLAGGVAIGTFADMMIGAWGAMLAGAVAGTVSVLGYRYLTPLLSKIKFHDTCGVNNLHGMPGLIAGLGGIVVAYMADKDKYGTNLYELFPARDPDGDDYSASQQAGMQAAALGATLGFAIVGGTITGAILRLPIWNAPSDEDLFEDTLFWQVPDEGYPHIFRDGKPLPNINEKPPGDRYTVQDEAR